MLRYEYTPIESEANEIRLLTILPGEFTDEIRITLHTTVLTKDSVPEYEALSYAWGSTENQPKITIFDRKEGPGSAGTSHTTRIGRKRHSFSLKRKIKVTPNLAHALPYLRYRDDERVLWIDAICVNQQDRVERSKQVQRMADVFSLAIRVVVWLGPEGEDSHCAIPLLAEIASHVEVDFKSWGVRPYCRADVDLRWSNMGEELPLEHVQVLQLCRFLGRKWFHRLWIWQEIHLSRDAVLMCGSGILGWKPFQTAVLCVAEGLNTFGRNVPARNALVYSVSSAFSLCVAERGVRLGRLIANTQSRECSDPRDRVFALLSLMWEEVVICPDYTQSLSEVYRNFVTAFIMRSSRLDLLQFCVMTEAHLGDSSLELPTWVPDFSRNNPRKQFTAQSPVETATNDVTFPDESTLSCLGVRLATVKTARPVGTTGCSIEQLRPVLRRLAPASDAAAESLYVAGGTCFEAFYRLICGHRKLEIPADQINATLYHARSAVFSALYHPQEPANVPDLVLEVIDVQLRAKALLETVEGYLATGPETTQPGDEVVCILGCASPFLLRRDGLSYRVVGPCHMEGFMYHEGILGPLPAHITRVRSFSQGYLPSWRNDVTGELMIIDPRWGPLPPGWSLKHHDKEHAFPWFENLQTGEGTATYYLNPFLKWQTLRDRGVKLDRFNII